MALQQKYLEMVETLVKTLQSQELPPDAPDECIFDPSRILYNAIRDAQSEIRVCKTKYKVIKENYPWKLKTADNNDNDKMYHLFTSEETDL
jgi:hypothetical protein